MCASCRRASLLTGTIGSVNFEKEKKISRQVFSSIHWFNFAAFHKLLTMTQILYVCRDRSLGQMSYLQESFHYYGFVGGVEIEYAKLSGREWLFAYVY